MYFQQDKASFTLCYIIYIYVGVEDVGVNHEGLFSPL